MSVYTELFFLFILVCLSAFLSCAEISLASARRSRLNVLADDGDRRARLVLDLQEHPGQFFSAIQIGTNALALLGGVVGEAAFSPFFKWCLSFVFTPEQIHGVDFVISFVLATLLFVIFADLLPKRLAVAKPEETAMTVVRPTFVMIKLLRPLVFVLEKFSDALMRSLGFSTKRQDTITSEDILASVGAGTAAGVLAPQEEAVIQNVFDLESRLVPSAMTPRENIVFFTLDDPEEEVRAKISSVPYNRFLICDKDLDHIIGYVDSMHILRQVLNNKPISFKEPGVVQTCPFIPDSLTLSEVLDVFQRSRADFAVILNEYALVVGVITINDVMSTVMGELVVNADELQIVERGRHVACRRLHADRRPRACARHRRVPRGHDLRDGRGLHDVHAAQDPQEDRQGRLGGLHLRGDRRRQQQDRPDPRDTQQAPRARCRRGRACQGRLRRHSLRLKRKRSPDRGSSFFFF